jgi:hypothetical protein
MQQLVKSAQGTTSRTIPAGEVMEGAGRKQTRRGWIEEVKRHRGRGGNRNHPDPKSTIY